MGVGFEVIGRNVTDIAGVDNAGSDVARVDQVLQPSGSVWIGVVVPSGHFARSGLEKYAHRCFAFEPKARGSENRFCFD